VKKRAFTLIELLIGMVIAGMLIAAGAAGLQAARISSRDTKRAADLGVYAKAIDQYLTVTRDRLPIAPGNTMSGIRPNSATMTAVHRYLPDSNNVPTDPLPSLTNDPNGTTYAGGYIYDQYVTGNTTGNAATALSVRYALTAGFERGNAVENTNLKTPPFGTISNRTPYTQVGTYCGNNCF
jgi:prepilin-type N-terminal cleavage/methylation domain-containing protein